MNKIIIEECEKINDGNIINIIKVLSKINGLEEFSIDSDLKKLSVTYTDDCLSKENLLATLEKSF